MKIINYIKQNTTALLISIFYVALGGIVACSLYPDDPLNGSWWPWGWLITLPVNIFSTSLRYTGDIGYFEIIVIQAIIFIPTFIFISRIIRKRKSYR